MGKTLVSEEKTNQPVLIFVHGFLGSDTDWIPIINSFSAYKCHVLNLFDEGPWTTNQIIESNELPNLSYEKFKTLDDICRWGMALNDYCENYFKGRPIYLVGYSLGGRLLSNAFLKKSHLYKKLILISSHFGLETDIDRQERFQVDREWAIAFAQSSWKEVMEKWHQQPVFNNSRGRSLALKNEEQRKFLSSSLLAWSLAHQSFVPELWKMQTDKLTYLVGDRDKKFLDLSTKWQSQIPGLRLNIIPNQSHRLIIDAPEVVIEILKKELHSKPSH